MVAVLSRHSDFVCQRQLEAGPGLQGDVQAVALFVEVEAGATVFVKQRQL